MTNRITFIGWLILATGLALCWYPLKHLKGMQIGSPQLLFYAFSSASLCSLPWLAYQVKQWRSRTQYLLQIGLTGAVAITFLHFSLLAGEPQTVISIFCLIPVVLIFVLRMLSAESLNPSEFLIFLMIVTASLIAIFGQGEGLSFNWSELMALVAGLFCYLLFRQHNVALEIPLASKLSAILICSTWLVWLLFFLQGLLVFLRKMLY